MKAGTPLQAGRSLDCLIAERVIGWRHTCGAECPAPKCWGWVDPDGVDMLRGDDVPAYSTDIAAAWEVISEMQRRGWSFILDDMCSGKTYQCHFERERTEVYNVTDIETVPLAICLAALKAVGE
jgi:hypothetical protein